MISFSHSCEISFAGQLVANQVDNCDVSVHGRKKHLWFLLRGPGYLRLPPPSHINHSLHISIYTYSSLSSLQVPLCSAEEGEGGGWREKRQNYCLGLRGRRGGGGVTTVRRWGKEERNSGFHQEKNAGRGPLISLEEERPTYRTKCLEPPDGRHLCCAVTVRPLTRARRSASTLESTYRRARHAQTCRMWKLTTYSALVRWTEMAKGSKGWKVKATRRRTAWLTGRPRRPAWILNLSRPESRA